MKNKCIVIFFLLLIFAVPVKVLGKIGVGIGTAKIEMNQDLKPGSINTTPSLSVVNNGDEAGDYEVGIEYQEGVSQLQPNREWFIFNPKIFRLEPNEVRTVEISMNLPVKTDPGEYFAYLEARPLKKAINSNGTSVGIAAAAKLYFTVEPAGFFSGIYHRADSIWKKYEPWTYVVVVVLFTAVIVAILSRFITLNIGFGKKKRYKSKSHGMPKKNTSIESGDVNTLLWDALNEVERYTGQLPEKKFEEIFIEAERNKQGILNYFYENNTSVLQVVSLELKNILILSNAGLQDIRHKSNSKSRYEEALSVVINGLIGPVKE